MTDLSQLQEFDQVVISGQATSPVKEFSDLAGVVATISRDIHNGQITHVKVWPVKPESEDETKVWFPVEAITALKVTEKCEPWEGEDDGR